MGSESSHRSLPPSAFPAELAGLLAEAWARSEVGMCLSDAAATIRASNAAFGAALGYAPEELIGLSLLRLLPAEAGVAGSAQHQTIIAGQAGRREMGPPPTFLHRDGRPMFAHVSDARLVAADGHVYRLTTLVDLEREAEGQPRLQQIQRAESFVALAGAISNDFNNLLSIILGYTAFLQDSTLDRRRLQMAVDGIEGAVARAADLIKQTLYLTRRTEPVMQRAVPRALLEDFARRLQADDAVPGMVVAVDADGASQAVSIDVYQIHHALREIVRKVREVLGRGCVVRLAARTVAGEHLAERFPEACETEYLTIEARFEAKPEETADVAALGAVARVIERRRDLVFMVTQTIVSAHRGGFSAEMEDGAAVFRVHLPVIAEPDRPAAPEPAGEVAATPPPPRGGAGPTVLLVDDEESLQHALGYALERLGCTVLKARDGIEAVDTFRAQGVRVALVICDLGLPRMSGWEAFMKMKDLRPGVRVLVMSGHLEPSLHAEMERAGAVGFLQKPFPIGLALTRVRALLGLDGQSTPVKR